MLAAYAPSSAGSRAVSDDEHSHGASISAYSLILYAIERVYSLALVYTVHGYL
jgi:hypothetical protein